jgi:hypothetical protein
MCKNRFLCIFAVLEKRRQSRAAFHLPIVDREDGFIFKVAQVETKAKKIFVRGFLLLLLCCARSRAFPCRDPPRRSFWGSRFLVWGEQKCQGTLQSRMTTRATKRPHKFPKSLMNCRLLFIQLHTYLFKH